jgi:Amino-transferase class IV
MRDYAAYFCGQWLPFSQVRIDPLDRGFLVGDCVFDVARTFNGKSFRMREHVARLYRSLRYVRIDPGLSPDEMERISEEVITRNEPLREEAGDYQIWQFVTRGRGRWAHKAGPPAVGVCVRQIGFSRFAGLYDTGAHGIIVRTRSFSPDALDPKVKNFSRMNFNLAELEASDVDPEGWPILTDSQTLANRSGDRHDTSSTVRHCWRACARTTRSPAGRSSGRSRRSPRGGRRAGDRVSQRLGLQPGRLGVDGKRQGRHAGRRPPGAHGRPGPRAGDRGRAGLRASRERSALKLARLDLVSCGPERAVADRSVRHHSTSEEDAHVETPGSVAGTARNRAVAGIGAVGAVAAAARPRDHEDRG